MMKISSHFGRGIPVITPAEFQSPEYLENDIVFGKVFNMEIVEEEIRAGISFKNLRSLLITNGPYRNREALAMKIVSKLIMKNTPSIIFDITGSWSKIIQYFRGTEFERKILHFKLGRTLTVNPLRSGIEFDKNNINYLDYIADSYGLAFKKRRNEIENYKKIKDNPEMNLSDLNLELKNKFDKRAGSGNPFYEFIQLKEQFFHSDSDNLLDKLDVLKFIQNDKTIIIDLSEAKDREAQLFLAFIFLSKFIHYVDDLENKFVRKFIILPSAETFFKRNFIERNDYEGKINSFLNPFLNKGFGLIFLVEQIHDLHSRLLNYFRNIISFRVMEDKDIIILKNILKLDGEIRRGVFSTSRKSKYHFEYLKDEMGIPGIDIPLMSIPIIKRVDVGFPFLISVGDKFLHKPRMSHERIIEFMNEQGYDFRTQERLIKDKTNKKMFERDFGIYAEFFPNIRKYLEGLRKLDDNAISKSKIEKGLSKCLKEPMKKYSQDLRDKNFVREKVFQLLLKHGYLETDARRTAGGSETLGTCYSVGSRLDKAVNEGFDNNDGIILEAKLETLEKETDNEDNIESMFQKENKVFQFDLDESELREVLKKVYVEKIYELFRLDECLNKEKDYKKALEFEREILESILIKVYQNLSDQKNLSNSISNKLMQEIINNIVGKVDGSFGENNFIYYLKKSSNMDNCNQLHIEAESKEISKYLLHIFNLFEEGISIT